jgi:hypothetical protein
MYLCTPRYVPIPSELTVPLRANGRPLLFCYRAILEMTANTLLQHTNIPGIRAVV